MDFSSSKETMQHSVFFSKLNFCSTVGWGGDRVMENYKSYINGKQNNLKTQIHTILYQRQNSCIIKASLERPLW